MGIVAHFHKAALHLFSERLVSAISRLDTRQKQSVRTFKREIRHIMAAFLRFTHRYWFHEVSNQAQARDLFNLMTSHLGTDRLYDEINEAVREMSEFLEADDMRRQAETVTRLTVVTTLSIIGTVATSFLGMNLIAAAEEPLWVKIAYFVVVFAVFAVIVFFTVSKSTAFAESFEIIANERASSEAKLVALMRALTSRLRKR
jgi:Mg2+ and Co2+ transporter CorA